MRVLTVAALVLLVGLGAAVGPARGGDAAGAAAAGPPALEVFVKPDCVHCERAKGWLGELRARRPELVVVVRDVAADPEARARLVALAARADVVAAVPAFVVGDRLVVGFDGPAATGATVEAWLDARDVGVDTIELPWFGTTTVRDLGLPLFTIVVGLVDGFNPCAMWVLLFLLSLLVNVRSRRRMLLVAGTFVVISGVAYYLFMAAWLGVFLVIGVSRGLQLALGVVALGIGGLHLKDGVRPGRGPSLSIPQAAKPGIYARVRRIVQAENLRGALVATVTLAVAVNLVELLCTAGLPALYTQILTAQGLSPAAYHGYLALYILAYMFDDALMVGIAVVTLGRHKLQERGGRILQLVSGAVMLVLGLLLLFQPGGLSFR